MSTAPVQVDAAGAARTPLAGRSVCVLLGGRSSERAVSLESGRAMVAALEGAAAAARAAGADAPRDVRAVELTPSGLWSVEGRELVPAEALLALPDHAVFALALHGGEGEGGVVQGLLEACGRPYTGSGVAASALCLDKHLTRLVLAEAGLRVAPGHLVRPDAWARDRRGELGRLRALGPGPWFVKPNRGGSSLGVSRIDAEEGLEPALAALLGAGDAALVEQGVAGVEATCAVLGNRGEALCALPPVEIRPRAEGFFDYREKYSESGAVELCPPEGFSAAISARLGEAALLAHRATGCDGVSRTDFIVPAGDGEPVALEVNTLPGMTARSLVPRSAAVAGMGFGELCLELVRLGLEARRERPA